jgi:hypothetical protein
MILSLAALLAGPMPASAEQPTRSEIDQMKQLLEQQERSIRELKARIQQLEGHTAPPAKAPAPAPAPVVTAPAAPSGEAPSPAETAEARMFGKRSKVAPRNQLDDRQEAATLPGDYVLDPSYRGYIPIPATVFMVKFNPKPRLDMMFTTRNPGDAKFRFAPVLFPTQSSPAFGGEQFNATANGSQIRVDMRAPTMPGNFRLYYQNDFFGSDTAQMRYRLQHFYGQYYGVVGGFTYSVFEDPDAWPDTVDYEGPVSQVFARKALMKYIHEIDDDWNITFGLEDPNIAVDTSGDDGATSQAKAPDGGFNVRWTPGDLGYMQFGTLLRSIGVRGDTFGDDTAFGWGVNLSGLFNLTDSDLVQFLGVFGEGVGGLGNDSGFQNTDAGFDANGDLEALEYASLMGAITHRWTPRWRSTVTYGYVHLDNSTLQAETAYHASQYGSVNLIYQLYKRLSIGAEALYGFREVKSGDDTNDVFRFNVALVYSPFD